MRQMYDALDPAGIPADAEYVAFYVDRISATAAQLRWPGRGLLSIARTASEDAACADCESGDLTPVQCPGWVARQRARGVADPWVYCSRSMLPNVQVAFRVQGVAEPLWWVADPGATGLFPGSVATQYSYQGVYDVSWLADRIPGFDPDPLEEHPMYDPILLSDGQGLWLVDSDGSLTGISPAAGRTYESISPEGLQTLHAARADRWAELLQATSGRAGTLAVSLTGTAAPAPASLTTTAAGS